MKWDFWIGNNDHQIVFHGKRLLSLAGFHVHLHKVVAADGPGCFHSHPAWAIRIVLWGGYVEETMDGRWRTFFPGRIGIVRPQFMHRIGGLRNGRSSWSLWLRGPKIREIEVTRC